MIDVEDVVIEGSVELDVVARPEPAGLLGGFGGLELIDRLEELVRVEGGGILVTEVVNVNVCVRV